MGNEIEAEANPNKGSELSNPLLAPSTYKISVAIDFGTDGVGLAYAYNNEVHAHTHWDTKCEEHSIKPKTQILLNGSGNKIAFGKDASMNYMSTDISTSKDWMLFENFKMHLYDPQNTYYNNINIENIDFIFNNKNTDEYANEYKINELANELIAVNGKKYSSELVFIQVFKCIKLECKRYLKTNKIKASASEIEYILTVPSIWNDKAKYKLKKWAHKSTLFSNMNQCRIVYEPDAASLFIQHELYYRYLKANQKNDEKSNDNEQQQGLPNLAHFKGNLSRLLKQTTLNDRHDEIDEIAKFEKGCQYILIDAGGGTADIACHEIVAEFGLEMGVKEVLPATGGAWGSKYIDQQYETLLNNIFTKPWIDEYRIVSPNGWCNVMDKFRFAKSKFFLNPKLTHHCVELPLEFLSFLEHKLANNGSNHDLQQFVSRIKIRFNKSKNNKQNKQKRMIELRDNNLVMTIELWKSMFNSVINPIIKHCEQLLESEYLSNAQYLCLVGGLCSSKYFQKRFKSAFGMESMHRLQIIIPSNPLLATVLGAAYLAITKNYIRSRILNATYGIEIDKTLQSATDSNVSKHNIEQYKYYNENVKKYFVRNCFAIYAKKKDIIQTGQIIEKTYNRIPADAKKIKIKIFYSVISRPTVTTSAVHLADLILSFEEKNVHQIVVEFHFYDTTIKVYSYPKGQKDKKQQIQLNYAITDLD